MDGYFNCFFFALLLSCLCATTKIAVNKGFVKFSALYAYFMALLSPSLLRIFKALLAASFCDSSELLPTPWQICGGCVDNVTMVRNSL